MTKPERSKHQRNLGARLDASVLKNLDTSVIETLLASLNTPRSLAIYLLFKNNEHDQLRNVEIDPHDYTCGFKFRDDYLATLCLSKCTYLTPVEGSLSEIALKKFLKCEESCRLTNHSFLNLDSYLLYTGKNASLLHAMTRKIEVLLGEVDPFELFQNAGWGPGTSTLSKGDRLSAATKFQNDFGISQHLYDFTKDLFPIAYPRWFEHIENNGNFVLNDFNHLTSVPKNSKTDRMIAIEPGINLFFQKSIGSIIRNRLKSVGLDLRTGQEKHQELARVASHDASLATIDFSSASDMISTEVVRQVLPSRWFSLLDTARSKGALINDVPVRWNKFSSMGNGFTFELETLIFFAAASVVAESMEERGIISVYGDDVILPNKCAELFSSFCGFLGFSVNKTKSFSSSAFRESCGAHFFDGIDCKPFFFKERSSDAKSLYKLANGIRRLAHRRSFNYGCDSRLLPAWLRIYSRAPQPLRLKGPDGFGDQWFIGSSDEFSDFSKSRRGWDGSFFKAIISSPIKYEENGTGINLARLWGQSFSLRDELSDLPKSDPYRRYTSYPSICNTLEERNSNNFRARTSDKMGSIFVPAPQYDIGAWL